MTVPILTLYCQHERSEGHLLYQRWLSGCGDFVIWHRCSRGKISFPLFEKSRTRAEMMLCGIEKRTTFVAKVCIDVYRAPWNLQSTLPIIVLLLCSAGSLYTSLGSPNISHSLGSIMRLQEPHGFLNKAEPVVHIHTKHLLPTCSVTLEVSNVSIAAMDAISAAMANAFD